MRLIEDEAVQLVGLGGHELVEVAEQGADAGVPVGSDLAERLGERARTGRVHHAAALAGELPHQGEGDDGLAGARTAGDDDRCLDVAAARLLDGVQDVLVGGPLLVEQDELLAVLDLFGRNREQLAAWGDAAVEEQVGGGGPSGVSCEVGLEEDQPVGAVLTSEDAGAVALGALEEVRDAQVCRVVQVGGTREVRLLIGEHTGEVGEVVAVPVYLQAGVEEVAVTGDGHKVLIALVQLCGVPLLELHHEIGRAPGGRVVSGEHDVGALAAERHCVLAEHLHVGEPGVHEVGAQDGETAFPGPALRSGHAGAGAEHQTLAEAVGDGLLDGRERLGRRPEQGGHRTPRAARSFVRVGACPAWEARRAAMTGSG